MASDKVVTLGAMGPRFHIALMMMQAIVLGDRIVNGKINLFFDFSTIVVERQICYFTMLMILKSSKLSFTA